MRRPNNKTDSASVESELFETIKLLTDEVRLLRIVIDELREEVQYGNHNAESVPLPSRRIQSCSLDPASRDFAVNTVDEATIENLRSELDSCEQTVQRGLFS